jgi:hypothetical protein
MASITKEGRIIKVTTRKTGKTVTVPIRPQFAAWFDKQTRGIGKAPVFLTLASKAEGGKSGLSMAFRRIMERGRLRGDCCAKSTASDVHNPA